jgi:DNA-binding NarL/FixJ family response regulator
MNSYGECSVGLLIVDDSEIMRERLKTMLSEVPKVETIDRAKNPQEAIEFVNKLHPDAVIMDVQMQGGSVLDLIREIKKGKKLPKLIILTNESYPQYRKRCFEAGADFFFDKSTEFDEVVKVLERAM